MELKGSSFIRNIRITIGRIFHWCALVAGICVHAVEIFFSVVALVQIWGGSCTAAFVGLLFGLPLVPIGPILFIIGAIITGRSDPKATEIGAIGAVLSLIAFPMWYILAFGVFGRFIEMLAK